MNHLHEEDFLSLSSLVHPDATLLHATRSKPHTASKFFSLFRGSKRRPQQNPPATTLPFEAPNDSTNTTANFYSATGNTSRQFRGHDLVVDRALVMPVSRTNASTGRDFEVGGGGIQSRGREFGPQRRMLTGEYVPNHESFAKPETATIVAIAQKQGVASQPEVRPGVLPRSAEGVVSQSDVFRGTEVCHPEVITSVTLPTFSRFRNQTGRDSPSHRRGAPGRRQAQGQIPLLPSLSPVASTEDGAPIDPQLLHVRRKSLPSIVKGPDSVLPSVRRREPSPSQSTTTPTPSGIRPEVKTGVTSVSPPEPETIVIEDGVRKRVTPVYGPRSPVRALAVGGRAGLPKLYRIESTEGRGRGSVPDLTEAALEGVEVPAREVVYALSQQRREELAKERMERDKRRGGQIILRLGDVKVSYRYLFPVECGVE